MKVSSKLLICADVKRLGERNSPVALLWRSSSLTHPSREGSPTSQPIPEVMNRPDFKVVCTQNYPVYYQCLGSMEPAAKCGWHPHTISGGIATQVDSKSIKTFELSRSVKPGSHYRQQIVPSNFCSKPAHACSHVGSRRQMCCKPSDQMAYVSLGSSA